MLELIIDFVVMLIIIYIVARGEHTEYLIIFICTTTVWVANYGIIFLLLELKWMGPFFLIPTFVITTFIIWGIFKISIRRALIASFLFFSYKLIFILILASRHTGEHISIRF